MQEQERAAKLDEVERLLNDPVVPMDPARVWALLDEVRADSVAGDADF